MLNADSVKGLLLKHKVRFKTAKASKAFIEAVISLANEKEQAVIKTEVKEEAPKRPLPTVTFKRQNTPRVNDAITTIVPGKESKGVSIMTERDSQRGDDAAGMKVS